jgi:7 transmembrane receptor (rhodopsin family)
MADIAEMTSSVTVEEDGFATASTVDLTWNETLNSNGTSETPIAVASLPEVVTVSIVVAILSLVTSGGNLMVLISFKMDRQLQTVSNYFLMSLAVADFAIGIVSMPLYTVYLLMKRWPLGAIVCDAWLSLDYTMSNASVSVFDYPIKFYCGCVHVIIVA